MRFTNDTGLQAGWTLGFERDGRELLVVLVKATYGLPLPGEPVELAEAQVPLVQSDQFTGEPGLSAPLFETDYAHRKPGCDVLLVGRAHAPHGRPTRRMAVGLQVGSMVKQFAVVGDRRWQKRLTGLSASEPESFLTQAIGYDHAFGGTDRTDEAKGRSDTFLANPVGRGYWTHSESADGMPLPNTEELERPVNTSTGQFVPMALSPIGRNWVPRMAYAGTYDAQWLQTTAPLWPADFDHRYFQAAPPDQVIAHPQGGEPVVLHNLTADGHRSFQLPVASMPITFIPYRGRDITQHAVIDTLVLEPERHHFTLTWRLSLPLGKSIFDVKEAVVGQQPEQWHRARRFPGKHYPGGLADLVAQKKSGSS